MGLSAPRIPAAPAATEKSPREDKASRQVAVIMTLRAPVRGKVERYPDFHVRGELGNRRPISCPVWHYKYRRWWGIGAHLFFLVLHSSQ
jgi:hypothetical protein